MSDEYGWKPRKVITLKCPESKQKVTVKRPGPEFAVRAGRVARTYTRAKANADTPDRLPNESDNEYYSRVIEQMSDEELAATIAFARVLVVEMMVSPKLVLNPNPEKDEIGPDDIGNDFWFLFNYAMSNFYGLKVPVGDGEVEVENLESFRPIDGLRGDSVDGAHTGATGEQLH